VVVVVRWLALAVGVAVSTLSFVRLVEEHDSAVGATPWWWLGLIGVAITVLALGSPWSRRAGRDDAPTRRGS
jgi:hypothetical protein